MKIKYHNELETKASSTKRKKKIKDLKKILALRSGVKVLSYTCKDFQHGRL